MNLLLDSHVFIWAYDERHKLSQTALQGDVKSCKHAIFECCQRVGNLKLK